MRSVFFVITLAALFAALTVGAPAARSQAGPFPRMTTSHQNAVAHFGLLDPSQPPTPTSGLYVGRFLSAGTTGTPIAEGHPFPDHTDPEFLFGILSPGAAIRRVSRSGALIDQVNLGDVFQEITGAFYVKSAHPNPQWIPSGVDLRDHYIVVGDLDPGYPGNSGNVGGMMLFDVATMTPFDIGMSNRFMSPSFRFEDVCFGVYAGPDGTYAQIDDNEYRYVMAYTTPGTDDSGLYCLSLNKHETMKGISPPPPFDPVQPVRGPDYTNAYPLMESNSKTDNEPITTAMGTPLHCRSWYARPGLSGFGGATDRVYAIAGWVQLLIDDVTDEYGPIIRGYSLGNLDPISPVTAITGPPGGIAAPNNNFGELSTNTQLFHSMVVVGDWLLCSLGEDTSGSGYGDFYQAVYIPEFIDGPGDGDNGVRAAYGPPGGAGRAGFQPSYAGAPTITYLGTGNGSSILYGSSLNPFQNHILGAGVIGTPAAIDMHTEEEKLMGMNVRQEPQPFAGYWVSEDPASTFPGGDGGAGGGGGGGGCSKSATGTPGGVGGLLALMAVAFVLRLVLKA